MKICLFIQQQGLLCSLDKALLNRNLRVHQLSMILSRDCVYSSNPVVSFLFVNMVKLSETDRIEILIMVDYGD
jgi:hypothetical protein